MKKITKDTLKIETEFMGTFHKALVTPEYTYFCNYEEGDMNGNTKMYSNETLELVADNYFAGQDFLRALEEDVHTFISEDSSLNLGLIIDAEMEIIKEEVELYHGEDDEEYTIFVSEMSETIFAKNHINNKVFRYRLKGKQEDIAKKHREEILEYSLGIAPEDEVVTLADIFMEGKHIELIK